MRVVEATRQSLIEFIANMSLLGFKVNLIHLSFPLSKTLWFRLANVDLTYNYTITQGTALLSRALYACELIHRGTKLGIGLGLGVGIKG